MAGGERPNPSRVSFMARASCSSAHIADTEHIPVARRVVWSGQMTQERTLRRGGPSRVQTLFCKT